MRASQNDWRRLSQQQTPTPPVSKLPVIASYTSDVNVSAGVPITLTVPSGLIVGEYLLAILANDSPSLNPFLPVSGWEIIEQSGTGVSDSMLAVFGRVVDGTEGATVDFYSDATASYHSGFMLRIQNVDNTKPIDVIGTHWEEWNSVHNIPSITVLDDTLAIAMISMDGGDGVPMTVTGTGWTKGDDNYGGAPSSAGVSLGWAYKDMVQAGDTEICTFTPSASDGCTGFQIGIKGSAGGSDPLGEEMIINGGFDDATGWSLQNEFQITGGTANTSAPLTAISWVYQNNPGVYYAGQTWRVTADIVVNAGSGVLAIQSNLSDTISTSGTYSFDILLASNSTFAGFRGNSGFDGSIDNISLKEVL